MRVVYLNHETSVGFKINISMYTYFFKRYFDVLVSLIILVLLSPILVFLYLITSVTSKGGGFYFQKRIGLAGKEFYIFKFRSMIVTAEGFNTPQLTELNDGRITVWGKFMRKYYLDELPQFLNVLRGDMSIVGPRPEREFFINQINRRGGNFNDLIQIKPGITSLGQIRYGYASSVDQMMSRLKYEKLYLKKISLYTDVKIILNTFVSVLKAKGM